MSPDQPPCLGNGDRVDGAGCVQQGLYARERGARGKVFLPGSCLASSACAFAILPRVGDPFVLFVRDERGSIGEPDLVAGAIVQDVEGTHNLRRPTRLIEYHVAGT